MVANYFTLLHLTKSLSATLPGLTLRECFSQDRHTLIIHASDHGPNVWLEISCGPAENAVVPRSSFARARKNTADVFPELNGTVIKELSLHPGDRQLTLELASGDRIVIQLFGASANIHWVSPENLVHASFLKKGSLAGKPLGDSNARPLAIPETLDELNPRSGISLAKLVREALPQLGSLYVKEVLYRSGCAGEETSDSLSAAAAGSLIRSLRSVLEELEHNPRPRLYEHPDEAPILSLIRLSHLAWDERPGTPSLEEALVYRIARHHRSKQLFEEKRRITSALDGQIRRLEKALTRIVEQATHAARHEQYERFGSLLMANLHVLSKGMSVAELEDIFDEQRRTVQIPLERPLSPAQNAERYFSKAKKARTAFQEAASRQRLLEEELRQARALRQAVDSANSHQELQTCVADHRMQLKKFGISPVRHSSKTEAEAVPFRVFAVAGGFTVWAGKSSANNDLLTMKYARPNDLWFHARGSGGSHVVLRSKSGKGEIPKRAVEEAAAIAAYYSKMRNAKVVPVAMTERKYVRKPKGSPAGTVAIQREKVLLVEPALPTHRDKELQE